MALFIPKCGGRFDATLNADKIVITHKFGIINDAQRPVAQSEFDTWKINFHNLVKQHWQGKYSFQRGTQTVRPKFKQIFEEDPANMADAHYVLRIRDGDGGNELVSSKPAALFEDLQKKGMYYPMASTLAAGSVKPTNSSGLIATELPKLFPAYVDTFNGTLKDQTKALVASFARQIAPLNANLKVFVTAYGTSKNASQTAVMNVLRANGLTNVTARSSAKFLKPSTWGTASTSKTSASTDYVKISLDGALDLTMITQPIYTYPAAAVHEFGHMIGLKDEYACLSDKAASKLVKLDFIDASEKAVYQAMHMNSARTETDEVAKQQAAFIKYCKLAGVEPTTFGSYTTSVMSAGSEFRPCHFVTIWAALVHLTGQNDWKIV